MLHKRMIKHIWKFCWKKKLKTQSQYFVNIYEAIHKFISFESHLNLSVQITCSLLIIIKQVHSTRNWKVTGLGFFIFYPHPPPPSPKDDWNLNPQISVCAHWKMKSEGFVLCRHLGKSCENKKLWVKIFFRFFYEKLDRTFLLETRHP